MTRTPRECLQAVIANLQMAANYSEQRSERAETVDVRERAYTSAKVLNESIALIRTECHSILENNS